MAEMRNSCQRDFIKLRKCRIHVNGISSNGGNAAFLATGFHQMAEMLNSCQRNFIKWRRCGIPVNGISSNCGNAEFLPTGFHQMAEMRNSYNVISRNSGNAEYGMWKCEYEFFVQNQPGWRAPPRGPSALLRLRLEGGRACPPASPDPKKV